MKLMVEYAHKVLGRVEPASGKRSRQLRFVESVPCAFCQGSGVYPIGNHQSRCGVCGGKGQVAVKPPVVNCLKCRGSGREGSDLTCLSCRGVGVVSVRKGATTCPRCHGTGEDGIFYCTPCKGQGIC